MYNLNDKSGAISEFQTYLSFIEFDNPIRVSGVFDEATSKATRSFKIKNGLADDDLVDKITFDSVYAAYLLRVKRSNDEKYAEWDSRIEMKIGRYSEYFILLNKLLIELSGYYGLHTDLRIQPIYSADTDEAVRGLFAIYGLDPDKYDSQMIYQRLREDRDSIEKLRKFFWKV